MCQLVEAVGQLRPRIRAQEPVNSSFHSHSNKMPRKMNFPFDPCSSSMDGVSPTPRPSDSVPSSVLYVLCFWNRNQHIWCSCPSSQDRRHHWHYTWSLALSRDMSCLLKGVGHEIEFKFLDKNEHRRINIYWRLSTEILCGPRCLLFVHCVSSWFLYSSIFWLQRTFQNC